MTKLFREPSHNKYVRAVMTVEEQARKQRLGQLKQELEKVEKELRDAQQECRDNHAPSKRIFYDEPGLDYTLRYCAVCGGRLETL